MAMRGIQMPAQGCGQGCQTLRLSARELNSPEGCMAAMDQRHNNSQGCAGLGSCAFCWLILVIFAGQVACIQQLAGS